jgi:cation diffusion facilitator family transporter
MMRDGRHEKIQVALASLLAAAFLTGAKLVVGILTNSLGIISEALHSGFDLVATGMTLVAVWIADSPADEEHRYGHGKFENLSALAETALLLVVCLWVAYEAVCRLFFRAEIEITPSVWAFAVVITSIIVDIWRGHHLHEAAEKYSSQALEADALHFSSDIWSSLVVLFGLICVVLAERLGWPWLIHADAIAALVVAGLVSLVCLRLGVRAVDALTDRTSRSLTGLVEDSAARVEGVEAVRDIRVRRSGTDIFADMTVLVPRELGLTQAHQVATNVTTAVQGQLPGADVVVHVEPVARENEDLVTTIRALAAGLGLPIHDVRVFSDSGANSVELHVEVNPGLNLEEAHNLVTRLESAIKSDVSNVESVLTHIEPGGMADSDTGELNQSTASAEPFHRAIADFGRASGTSMVGHQLVTRQTPQGISLTFHLHLDGDLPIGTAHEISRNLESYLFRRFPELSRIVIHLEPRPSSHERSSQEGPASSQDERTDG